MFLPRSQFVANGSLVVPSTAAEEWYNVFLSSHKRGNDCYTFLQTSRQKLQRLSHQQAGSEPASCRRTIGSSHCIMAPIPPPAKSPLLLTKPIVKVLNGDPPRLMSDLPPNLTIDPSELHFERVKRNGEGSPGVLGTNGTVHVSKGTFGTVYRATWRNKTVAVKLSHVDTPPSFEQLKNFERELNTYYILGDDPNVCKFFGACVKNLRMLLIVTEFVERGNVFDLFFDNQYTVSSAVRLEMARQLSGVVSRLHAHRPAIIHRDLKTPNVLIDHDFNIKLCDFGKTRFMLDDNGGSPRYMAPECYVLDGPISEKSDIWSLACCLIEILGGPIPFEECYENPEVVHKLFTLHESPTVPDWFHPTIRQSLIECFSWTPEERPSAADINALFTNSITPADLDAYGMNTKRGLSN